MRRLREDEKQPLATVHSLHHQATADIQEGEGSASFVLITEQSQDHEEPDTEESKRSDQLLMAGRVKEGTCARGGKETDKEAASPGAAGNLTGADGRAGQEQ